MAVGANTEARSVEGAGRRGMKRNNKILKDSIQGITRPSIRRLARRGGVKRISGLMYEETRDVLKVFLENMIRDTITYTEHAKLSERCKNDGRYEINVSGDGIVPSASPPTYTPPPAPPTTVTTTTPTAPPLSNTPLSNTPISNTPLPNTPLPNTPLPNTSGNDNNNGGESTGLIIGAIGGGLFVLATLIINQNRGGIQRT
ncbi:18109_t:CDS:2 [Entrophospora sp. SA101]|nr:18109_t:CDS:2 [Entrophospora sp. SA101]CAJ0837315.1 5764_t:CDS:2 [Entrophospora sp. SA101]